MARLRATPRIRIAKNGVVSGTDFTSSGSAQWLGRNFFISVRAAAYAEIIAANQVEIACSRGPGAVTAMGEIADRCEGRPRQEIAVEDTRELRSKSDEELTFHVENSRWRTDDELRAH
jgi:hypothetical protein